MSLPLSPKQNHILAALPAADYARLLPDLDPIAMPLGWAVYEPGDKRGYVYFPATSVVSLLHVTESGAGTEIAVIGNEGLVGFSLFMSGGSSPRRAVVQTAGEGYRIKAGILKREFALGGNLQQLALRFTQAVLTQTAQAAACNRHHALDQQFCRWLLSRLDRLQGNELVMTQELIANMLGASREGVNDVAGRLQADGLIQYSRGHIKVLDRPALEQRVCECYAAVKKELDRLLPYTVRDLSK
jgi:CRP-like cAMP-binding protein